MSSTLCLYSDSSDSPVKVVVLDGGLGTTLENSLDISHTPLWSAKAVIEHPEVVLNAHLAFLRAGARIILTSTYQCSTSTFATAGYSETDARAIMSKCVRLTAEARSQCYATEWQSIPADGPNSSASEDPGAVKIALSLGPFGAGLSPAQEFDGYYPPPFGPRRYTRGDDNCNAFPKDDDGRQKEDEATAALTQFHFERLGVFADDEAAWDTLDFIAFETVPLVREIRAIRMAMAAFQTRRPSVQRKPWWISFVFPQGKFPETGEGGSNVPVRSVVAAALLGIPAPAGSDPLPIPSALGINCTEVELIPAVLADMEAAVLEFQTQECRPWLVLYPNGGDVYNPISQTWEVKDKSGDVWAEKLANIIAKIQSDSVRSRIWSGVVAGGCCRTGPEDIGLLNKQLQLGVQGK